MAISRKARGLWWSRFHFLIRFLGLTGLLAAVAAVTVAWRQRIIEGWQPNDKGWAPAPLWEYVQERAAESWAQITTAAESATWTEPKIVVTVLLAGAALTVVLLVIELLAALAIVSGRRSAFGTNALVQVGLAVALLGAVNYFSFGHYHRFDWSHDPQTGEPQFTLPKEISDQLRRLKGETLIVVDQRRETFGQNKEKADAFDRAAKHIVVEKVKDLVEQFREFGPQFRVEVLDVEKEGFAQQLADLTENRPALRDALEKVPENSIFFCSPDGRHVQALSFNDFYQLDKTASKENNNLVLLNQGVKPFAEKVLNVEARRPRIGIAVIHPALATTGRDDIGFPGLKTALESRGFDVQDIVLKKWTEFGPPTATIATVEESKLDELEEDQTIAEINLKSLEQARKQLDEELQDLRKSTLDELTKKYSKQLRGRKMTEEIRKAVVSQDQEELADIAAETARQRARRDEILAEKSKLNVDQILEQRRIDDMQAKFAKVLMGCDLLLIPRLTILDVRTGAMIPNRLYRIDEGQVNAIREYLKAGKPVLACFGPSSDSPDDRMSMMDAPGPDGLEQLFEQLGVRFGKQTVLFDSESESLASSRSSPLRGASRVPALDFEWQRGAGLPALLRSRAPDRPNPLQDAMRVAARSLGKDSEGRDSLFDLRLRHPRPIYYEVPDGKTLAWDPTFLLTSSASWNEDKPFPTRERTPHYERPKPDDPDRGTLNEKRRGPFPVGIAVETPIPATWQPSATTAAAPIRIAVVGHGGLFTGGELSPAKEKLLLNTVNWLLGRDEYLPKADHQWSYPRVSLDSNDKWLWHWGTQAALPGLFAYIGLIVLLVRRLR
jgi:hypothetical protein